MIIVLLGPDGSGKTTIADKLTERLNTKEISKAIHLPHRFHIFPTISSLLKGDIKADVNIDRSDYVTPTDIVNGKLKTFLLMSYYAFEYLIAKVLYRNKIKSKQYFFVFARYYYDYFFQSNNIHLPLKYKKIFLKLIPLPKFVFFLDADAEIIYARKPELELSEIIKQQNNILNHSKIFGENFIRLDCNKPVINIVDEIISMVLK